MMILFLILVGIGIFILVRYVHHVSSPSLHSLEILKNATPVAKSLEKSLRG